MVYKVDAIYENGVLQPIGPLGGLPEHALVSITVDASAGYAADLAGHFGPQPDDSAEDMTELVAAEYARMNPCH